MDWLVYTAAVVAHLWALIAIFGFVLAITDTRVKLGLGRVKISPMFFAPFIGVLAFWMWFFVG